MTPAADLESLQPVDDVSDAFARAVGEAFDGRVGARFTVALSGGPTARACYERLATEDIVDWSVTTVLIGDERMVPPDDPDANQLLIRQALLDRVGPIGAFRPMPTDGSPEACAATYQSVIAEVLATDGIDVIHLGMGPDGHTASLFPHSSALGAGPDQLVLANTDPSGLNPHPRLTLTLPAINQARTALFTVAGASKRDAFAALRAGQDLPAARVSVGTVRWLVDTAAFAPGPDQEVAAR
jgi:6-phosphogluconolactonase